MKCFDVVFKVFLVMGAVTACARGATIASGGAAVRHAEAVTAKYDLFPPDTGCLTFDLYQGDPGDYIVRARLTGSERCTGSAKVSVDLFFLKIRKQDGATTTTAYTLDGRFLPLRGVATTAAPAGGIRIETEAAALWRAMSVTAAYHLSPLKPECETFTPECDDADFYRVDVFEHHSKACGGDPNTAPRLFSLRVQKSDGDVMTDAYDPARGAWEKLRTPAGKASPSAKQPR